MSRFFRLRLIDIDTCIVRDEEANREIARFSISEAPGIFDEEQGLESGWRWAVEAHDGSSGGGFLVDARKTTEAKP